MNYDVLVIGGGVVGSAIARELSRYCIKICVVEKEGDVCNGNSGRNTGLLHAGFMYEPGSLKAVLSVEGNRTFDCLAKELDMPLKRTGKLMVGSTEEERLRLLQLIERGAQNGVPGLKMIDSKELHDIEPNIKGEFALYSPTSALISPYLYAIALAENAAMNGVDYHLNQEVISVETLAGSSYRIKTRDNIYEAKWVINSSGLSSDSVAAMLGFPGFSLKKIKGEYLLLDKKAGDYLSVPVYPAPNEYGLCDVHLTPSLDGNVLVGPTFDEEVYDCDFDITQRAYLELEKKGGELFDQQIRPWIIRSFSGIFPHAVDPKTGKEDFIIEHHPETTIINLVGINSPGITSAYPIAKRVASIVVKQEGVAENPIFDPIRKGIRSFADQDIETQYKMIAQNPDYGEIVCRCECITKAEILQALNNPLGVSCVTGIKYRTRASMGRCQGGYCETRITAMIKEQLGVEEIDIRYKSEDSYMFTGRVRP